MNKLYAVRDVKSDSFGAPMSIASLGLAKRALVEIVKGGQGPVALYPADFMLYELGEYDEDSGTITPVLPAPRFVATVQEIVHEAQSVPAAAPGAKSLESKRRFFTKSGKLRKGKAIRRAYRQQLKREKSLGMR